MMNQHDTHIKRANQQSVLHNTNLSHLAKMSRSLILINKGHNTA